MATVEHWIIGDVAVGGDGVATITTETPFVVLGRIAAVGVVYRDSPPAGSTDVTVRTANRNRGLPDVTILTLTNAAADGWFLPRVQVHDTVGAALATAGSEEIFEAPVVNDHIEVVLAGANAGDSVDVCLVVER